MNRSDGGRHYLHLQQSDVFRAAARPCWCFVQPFFLNGGITSFPAEVNSDSEEAPQLFCRTLLPGSRPRLAQIVHLSIRFSSEPPAASRSAGSAATEVFFPSPNSALTYPNEDVFSPYMQLVPLGLEQTLPGTHPAFNLSGLQPFTLRASRLRLQGKELSQRASEEQTSAGCCVSTPQSDQQS